ncbi:heat shock 70 kDa protein 12A-like [Ruditapes philippinarum]|uniref:heat shock 70 kDa protein 12A-like n=1 Tax=Ruditapes philippinarum TaxID=129788 RepID=UPI00295ACF51|nr:heat shock 70 kDa protein 12A-like [Ruditapes philippinarum]
MACSRSDVERLEQSRSNHLVVAAIDFGTTYTGFAYSFKSDSTKIVTSRWTGENVRTATEKAPTCVLLSPDKRFVAFGYEAEEKYKELLEEDAKNADGHYFFERFKMKLYETKNLKLDTLITDAVGKELPAIDVFAVVITHIKEKVYKQLKSTYSGFNEDSDILWVLTVPAIWSESAKQFMRKAANEAGLKAENVRLILEPEAASLYCNDKHLCKVTLANGDNMAEKLPEGTQYIVADLGGGTADISVHEVLKSRNLREIQRARGDALGGMMVDQEFLKFLEEIFGTDVFRLFSNKYRHHLMDIQLNFETKKRTLNLKSSDDIKIKLPISQLNGVLSELKEENVKNKIREFSKKAGFQSLKLITDKLCFEKVIMEMFFENAKDGILKLLDEVLEKDKLTDKINLLMVGGFSESVYVQDVIKQKFPNLTVLVPQDPSLSVLKGAVTVGHNPKTITERIARYTYGFSISRPFNDGRDPLDLKVLRNGQKICKNVFFKLITKGGVLKIGDHFDMPYNHKLENTNILREAMRMLPLSAYVYRSEENDPKYTEEKFGCELVGKVTIPPPPSGWPHSSSLVYELVVGEAEFTVRALNLKTNMKTEGQLDFLETNQREVSKFAVSS